MFFRKRKKPEFPFNEPEYGKVFACVHVLEGTKDICQVFYESDKTWRFLCGQEHDDSDIKVVSLKEIYDIDSSIGKLADLPPNYEVMRSNKKCQWMENKW